MIGNEEEYTFLVENSLVEDFRFKSKEITKDFAPKNFPWTPSIYLSSRDEKWAILIRVSEKNIPDPLLSRMIITRIKFPHIKLFVAVPSKNVRFFEKLCKINGLGLIELCSKKIKIVIPPFVKKYKKPERGVKKQKPHVYIIFVSSKQDIAERDICKKIIPLFGNIIAPHKIEPVFHEYRGYPDSKKTWKEIKNDIDKSDYFIAILSKEYRKWVEKEIKYAFKILNKKKISILVRSVSKKEGGEGFKLIKWIEDEQIFKYATYESNNHFKDQLITELSRLFRSIIPRE